MLLGRRKLLGLRWLWSQTMLHIAKPIPHSQPREPKQHSIIGYLALLGLGSDFLGYPFLASEGKDRVYRVFVPMLKHICLKP